MIWRLGCISHPYFHADDNFTHLCITTWNLEHTYMSFNFSLLVCFSILNSVLHSHNKQRTWLKLLYRNRVNIFLSDPPSWQIGYLAICLDTFLGGKKEHIFDFQCPRWDHICHCSNSRWHHVNNTTTIPLKMSCLSRIYKCPCNDDKRRDPTGLHWWYFFLPFFFNRQIWCHGSIYSCHRHKK